MTYGQGTWIFDADPFCRWGTVRCFCHSFNITKQQCHRTPVQPLTASYFVGIQVLEMTSAYLFLNRHLRHSFLILSGSANTIQTSLIKLHCKWGTVEEIIKKDHTVTIFKGFSLFKKFTCSQIFFCPYFYTQVQVRLIEVAQRYQNLKHHLISLFLTYCFMLDRPLNFTIWRLSFETKLLTLWLKWLIKDLTL